jgi:hypothetical protein
MTGRMFQLVFIRWIVWVNLTLHRSFGNNDQDDFRRVSGILRLSTKYLCDSLRAKALAHLSIAWPSDLKSWDGREDATRYEMDPEHPTNTGPIYPTPIVSCGVTGIPLKLILCCLRPSSTLHGKLMHQLYFLQHFMISHDIPTPKYLKPQTRARQTHLHHHQPFL